MRIRPLEPSLRSCLLVALGLGLTASPSAAETPHRLRFGHLGIEDGLSHSSAWDVRQDEVGFLWIATETYLHRFDGYRFRAYPHDPDDPTSPSANEITKIFVDRKGRIWLSTRYSGLNRYLPASDSFTCYPTLSSDHSPIREDHEGNLWLLTDEGLVRFEPDTGATTPMAGPQEDIEDFLADRAGTRWLATKRGLARLEGHDIRLVGSGPENAYLLFEGHRGIWVATSEGDLHRYEPEKGRWWFAGSIGALPMLPEADGAGQFWLGSYGAGLFRFDPISGRLDNWRHDPADPESIGENQVFSTSIDRHGELWIGTRNGVSRFSTRRSRFRVVRYHPETGKGLPSRNVTALEEDSRGTLWIGSPNGELTAWDRDLSFETAQRAGTSQLGFGAIKALLSDPSGKLWVGGEGGFGYLPTVGERREIRQLDGEHVHDLERDAAGNLWLGGWMSGLRRFDPRTRKIDALDVEPTAATAFPSKTVYTLTRDRSGFIWAGTNNGLARVDPESRAISSWPADSIHRENRAAGRIADVHEDASGRLWLATYGGGLIHFDRQRGTFRQYLQKDGLASNHVVGILEGDDGRLWLTTNLGMSRFDPDAGDTHTYGRIDGLASDVFLTGAHLKTRDGAFLVGGHNGLTIFFPDQLQADSHSPPVVLTDLRMAGRRIRPGVSSSLQTSITTLDALTLSHHQRSFSLEFAALHYAAPMANRYAYRLQGLDPQWIETDASRRLASYTNLGPGDYVFQVKASNKDGVWNETGVRLDIRVLPAPWRSGWAYACYALVLGLGIAGYVRWNERRLRRERQVISRLREVDRLKNEFLANTSHELRTPLYGISGLAESLLDRSDLAAASRDSLRMIVTSSSRLSNLVNDILDFSKLRHRTLNLDLRAVDLAPLVELVTSLSQPLATDKGLHLGTRIPEGLTRVRADENRLQQILLNLVGNAIKFTESGAVEVCAEARNGEVRISVTDSGVGIAAEDLERIFQPFEQADASAGRLYGGTGLGLAVTRQLVELHGGELTASSTLGEGSTFSFMLPVASGPQIELSAEASAAPALSTRPLILTDAASTDLHPRDTPPALGGTDRPTILITDDEPMIRQVLVSQLSQLGYRLLQARNGEEALALLEERPDLVLLDVMMPRMSGFDVCRAIRQRHSLDDLPVIYLTARTQPEDLVTGFATGANDFLTKPIHKDELLARVRTQLDLVQMHRHLDQLLSERTTQVETLSQLLPICASCKKVRDDDGYWQELETYICEHTDSRLSHGLCLECASQLYPELDLGSQLR